MKGVLAKMTKFMPNYNKSSIIVANMLYRHYFEEAAMINLDVWAFNRKLNKTAKLFRHVASVEICPNSYYRDI
jgi:hypothetical protein